MDIDSFIISSIKLLGSGVVIRYSESGKSAIITYEDSKRLPDPEFKSAMDGMGVYFDKVFALGDVGSVVKGVNFKGENIQLTGMLEAQDGSMCSLNTPSFSLIDNSFGLPEKDLLNDISSLKTEAFLYISELKGAQQVMDLKESDANSVE